MLGTIRLLLDDGLTPSGTFRFGDIRLDVPVPAEEVATLAGHPGSWGYADGRGAGVRFGSGGPSGLVVDHDGSVVVADPSNHTIRRISPDGSATTIAGGLGPGLRDGPADVAQFKSPVDVALSPDGSIYVADAGNRRIRKIGPGGVVTTVAGTDPETDLADFIRDGPALEAILLWPSALALTHRGTSTSSTGTGSGAFRRRARCSRWPEPGAPVIGTDQQRRPSSGSCSTWMSMPQAMSMCLTLTAAAPVSGGHTRPSAWSTLPGWFARSTSDEPRYGGTLAWPSGIAVTDRGEIFLSNTGRHQIVRLGANGELHGVAGTGEKGLLNGPRAGAQFSYPRELQSHGTGSSSWSTSRGR